MIAFNVIITEPGGGYYLSTQRVPGHNPGLAGIKALQRYKERKGASVILPSFASMKSALRSNKPIQEIVLLDISSTRLKVEIQKI